MPALYFMDYKIHKILSFMGYEIKAYKSVLECVIICWIRHFYKACSKIL